MFAEEMRRRMREHPRERTCEYEGCAARIGRWRERPYCDEHEEIARAESDVRTTTKKDVKVKLPSLEVCRVRHGISAYRLAHVAGLSDSNIRRVERGGECSEGLGKRAVAGLRILTGDQTLTLADLMAEPDPLEVERMCEGKAVPRCQAEGCEEHPVARGLCNKHYYRWYRRRSKTESDGEEVA